MEQEKSATENVVFKWFRRVLAALVVFIILVLIVGHPFRGGTRLGFLGDIILEIAKTPDTLKGLLKDENPHGVEIPEGDHKPIGEVNLPILNDYSMLYYQWPNEVVLYSFGEKRETRVYPISQELIDISGQLNPEEIGVAGFTDNAWSPDMVRNAVLDGTDIIFQIGLRSNLCRIDTSGKVLWTNDEGYFHHSIEIDDSLIYTCGIDTGSWYGKEYGYREDNVYVINKNTGKTIDTYSISRILDKNGYMKGLLSSLQYDPIHLNDVEPVRNSGRFWQKGDIGLSIRNQNMVCIYRPSTDSIVWEETGTVLAQHDIDFIGDSVVRVFDNNLPNFRLHKPPLNGREHYSRVVEFDLANGQRTVMLDGVFSTMSEGRDQLYDGFTFVEETNSGFYYIMDDTGKVLEKFYVPFKRVESKRAQYPCWTRLYRKTDVGYVEN